MSFLDALKQVPGEVADAVTHPMSSADALGSDTGALLGGAKQHIVNTFGRVKSIDPATGAMVESAPTGRGAVANILGGALTGMAATRPGMTFAEGLGQGAAAVRAQQRTQLNNQFERTMAQLRQSDLDRYHNAVAKAAEQRAMGALAGVDLNNKKLAAAYRKDAEQLDSQYAKMGATRAAFLGDYHDLADFEAQDPQVYRKYASGQYAIVPGPDGVTVWDTSTVPNAPMTATILLPDAKGKMVPTKVTGSRSKILALTAKSGEMTLTHTRNAEQARHDRAEEQSAAASRQLRRQNAAAANATRRGDAILEQQGSNYRERQREYNASQAKSGVAAPAPAPMVLPSGAPVAVHPAAPALRAPAPQVFAFPIRVRLPNGMTGTLAAGHPLPAGAQRIQ